MIKEQIENTGFANLNPYSSVVSIVADNPEELAKELSKITEQIKIIGFNTYGSRQVCYFLVGSGVKINKIKNKK